MILLFLKLIIGHCVADYPLQGDFLARGKNYKTAFPGMHWTAIMSVHAALQAGSVWLLTGSPVLGGCEFVCHWLTDYAKCADRISFNTDQLVHLACKLLWAGIAVYVL
jgi:hypothetical protein